jgi:hypothetical protein
MDLQPQTARPPKLYPGGFFNFHAVNTGGASTQIHRKAYLAYF